VHWPAPGERLAAETDAASAHRLVCLDLTPPRTSR
jgi:hypothetical protein